MADVHSVSATSGIVGPDAGLFYVLLCDSDWLRH